MKKGFTLIELLAVIVILAIISLIATPIVLNIIENAEESTMLSNAQLYLDPVEYSILNKRLDRVKVKDGSHHIQFFFINNLKYVKINTKEVIIWFI